MMPKDAVVETGQKMPMMPNDAVVESGQKMPLRFMICWGKYYSITALQVKNRNKNEK